MEGLTASLVVVIVAALLFDFVNGWNDAANAIATVVGTRVLRPLAAVLLAAVLNLAGAFAGEAVAKTIYRDIVAPDHGTHLVVLAAMLSAILWAGWMTLLGMPISGSHSLIGGLTGAAVAKAGVQALIARGIIKTLLAMLFAPIMGFLVGYLFYVGIIWTMRRVRPSIMNRSFGFLQLLSASWMAFAHGMNDAQKVMGVITIALIHAGLQSPGSERVQPWVIVTCGTAISLGTAFGGWKVIKTLGYHLTRLHPTEGFAAETAAAGVLSLAAWLGIPTSTTHTITGSILGVGATRGMSTVKWGVGQKIVLAWVFTLPSTAALAGTLFWILQTSGFGP